jgi:hypothetical protein
MKVASPVPTPQSEGSRLLDSWLFRNTLGFSKVEVTEQET